MSRLNVRHTLLKAYEIGAGHLFLSGPVQAIWRRLPVWGDGPVDAPRTAQRVAVVAHVYYLELLPEVLACWTNVAAGAKAQGLPDPVALHVTTLDTRADDVTAYLMSALPDLSAISVHGGPNRGRDIAPFVQLLNDGALDSYDTVLKLHTKKSPHLWTGNLRRRLLFTVLAGSTRHTRAVLRLMSNPTAGMAGWASSFRGKPGWWMANEARVRDLSGQMTPRGDAQPGFFEGSMFWVRPKALAALRSLALKTSDFETEQGQTDGALHHAVERMFTVSAWASGFKVYNLSGTELRPQVSSHDALQAQATPA